MVNRLAVLAAVAMLTIACATTGASGTPQDPRSEGSIEMFEMHPGPSVDTRTDFSDMSVRNGSIRGPAQGPNGRVANWLDRSAPGTWTGSVWSGPKTPVEPAPAWSGPCMMAVEGRYQQVPVEFHADDGRITGRDTDLTLSRTATGFRIQGTWLGVPRDIEVTSRNIVSRSGACPRGWTRIDPGLYQRDDRHQIRVRLEGSAADPATAQFPQAAFAVLLSGL